MSIRKNNNSSSDLHVTCQRLSKLPISSTVGATEYNITQYVHCQNAGFKTGRSGMYQGTCLMRAIIPTTATGYILGCRYTNSTDYDMYCRIEDVNGVKSVVWHYLGSTIGSRPLDPQGQPHDYGFVNGYAVYDHEKVVPNQVLATPPRKTTREFGFGCCSYYYGSGDSYDYCSDIYIIRCDCDLYEFFTPAAYEMAWLCRFYPIYRGFYNAMRLINYSLNDTTGEGGSITEGPDLVEPYGIQKDDLVYITKGKYKDVLALMTDDGGVDARSGQAAADIDPPYTEIAGHSLAFDMRNTAYPGGITPNPSTSLPDRRGRLLRGRKPKWDIWQDSVAHGFYIMDDNGVKTLMFNIFKLANGEDTDVHLEWFDGYNTDPATSHPPTLIVNNEAGIIQFHNGGNYRCYGGTLCIPYEIYDKYIDNGCIFYVENVADLDYTVKLGNAIPWNIPTSELSEDYGIVGGGVAITIGNDVYAQTAGRESAHMCADSPASAAERALLQAKYRTDGMSGALVLNYLIPALRNMLLSATGNTIDAVAEISMVNIRNVKIRMPELCGNSNISLTGQFNTTLDSSPSEYVTNKRQFVAEWFTYGSNKKYMAYLSRYYTALSGTDMEAYKYNSVAADPKCLILIGQECNAEGTQLIEDLTSTFYAMVTLEIASSSQPNVINTRACGMIAGITNIDISNPPSTGTKEHSAYVCGNYYGGSWYKDGSSILSASYPSIYSNYFAATRDDLGLASDFNNYELSHANIRYDIYRSDVARLLALYDGIYMPKPETTAWCKENSIVQNTTPVFIHRISDEVMIASNNIVCNTYMRKHKNTNADPSIYDTSGWKVFNEGPESGQSDPSFVGTVKVQKKAMGASSYTDVATFTFTSEDSFGSASGIYPRQYEQIRKTSGNYTCSVNFSEEPVPFNSPNGGAETLGNTGYLWYYSCLITTTDSIAAGDTYKVKFE